MAAHFVIGLFTHFNKGKIMRGGAGSVVRAACVAVQQLEERLLLSGARDTAERWVIRGDQEGQSNDVIVVGLMPGDDSMLRATINDDEVATRAVEGLREIQVGAGLGNDTVSIELGEVGVDQDIVVGVWGGPGNDQILGDGGTDRFYGGSGRDSLDGEGGDDSLFGERGNDDLSGGDDADYLSGGDGSDTLGGGWGTDRLDGAGGSDQLDGGDGRDHLDGGADRDTLKGGDGRDAVDGGGSRDTLYLQWGRDTYADDAADRHRTDDVRLPLNRIGHDAMRASLLAEAPKIWQASFDQRVYFAMPWAGLEGEASAAASGGASGGFNPQPSPIPEGDSVAPGDFSQTNVQVLGVDEADFVKTDGNYLYTLGERGVSIVDAGNKTLVDQEAVEGTPVGLYLRGSRLTVITYTWKLDKLKLPEGVTLGADSLVGYWGEYPQVVDEHVTVSVLDVTDPANPRVAEETRLDGSYVDSRAIGDRVYVVVSNPMHIPPPRYVADGPTHVKYESEESYMNWLETGGLEESVPGYESTGDDGDSASGTLVDGDQLWVKDGVTDLAYQQTYSVALLDVMDDYADVVNATSVVGWAPTVFASPGAMYMTSATGDWDPITGEYQSQIVKFTLGSDAVSFAASAKVAGNVLNSFSMDEYGPYFRIATTGSWDAGSNVYVLDQVGSELRLVGSVGGIAPGEEIYAVRFMGERGYVVTYQIVLRDPLFTLDLSDPAAPRAVGELHIPGFSRYLHPIDDTHLIGLGQDDDGAPQLSLFDVSDIANPTRTAVYVVQGDGDSYPESVSDDDHHAFAYFPAQGILTFPVREYLPNGDWQTRTEVVRVDLDGGFTRVGGVVHPGYNWKLRAVRIGQTLFSISDGRVLVTELEHPENVIANIAL